MLLSIFIMSPLNYRVVSFSVLHDVVVHCTQFTAHSSAMIVQILCIYLLSCEYSRAHTLLELGLLSLARSAIFRCYLIVHRFFNLLFGFSVDNKWNLCVRHEQICGDAIDVLRAKVCFQPIEFGFLVGVSSFFWVRRHFGKNKWKNGFANKSRIMVLRSSFHSLTSNTGTLRVIHTCLLSFVRFHFFPFSYT